MLALDTNILAYAEGVDDAIRQARALDVIAGLDASLIVVPVQVLGELYRVLTVKAGRSVTRIVAEMHEPSWLRRD